MPDNNNSVLNTWRSVATGSLVQLNDGYVPPPQSGLVQDVTQKSFGEAPPDEEQIVPIDQKQDVVGDVTIGIPLAMQQRVNQISMGSVAGSNITDVYKSYIS